MPFKEVVEILFPLFFILFLIRLRTRGKFLDTQVPRFWLFIALATNLIFIEFLRSYGPSGPVHKFVSYFYNWFPAQEKWLDARILYESVGCSKQYNLFEPNPCFTFLWNYPTFYNSIPPALNYFIFFIFLAFFPILVFVIYFFLSQKRLTVLVLMFWISPPVLFLIERANFEGLIVLLLIMAERLFFRFQNSQGKWRFVSLGIFSLLVTLAIAIKFYPIVILLYFFLTSRRLGTRLFIVILLLLNLFMSIAFLDLLLFVGNAPSPDGKALGLKVLIGNILAGPFNFFIFSAFMLLSLKISKQHWKNLKLLLVSSYEREAFGLSLVFLFLCTWMVGGNTQYRLVLLAPYFINSSFQREFNRDIPLIFLAICFTTTWPILSNLLTLVLLIPISKSVYSFSRSVFLKNRLGT